MMSPFPVLGEVEVKLEFEHLTLKGAIFSFEQYF